MERHLRQINRIKEDILWVLSGWYLLSVRVIKKLSLYYILILNLSDAKGVIKKGIYSKS
jgi:hypothetical protein